MPGCKNPPDSPKWGRGKLVAQGILSLGTLECLFFSHRHAVIYMGDKIVNLPSFRIKNAN